MAILVVVALLAGGAYVLAQRDDAASDASSAAPERTTSTAPKATTTTTPAIAWTPVTDPASGLTWTVPGTDVSSMPSSIYHGTNGPIAMNPTTWLVNGQADATGPKASISVWAPSLGATQGTVDEYLDWNASLYERTNAPYPKQLLIAGQPATVVDASTGQRAMWEAAAAVDGSLVVVSMAAYDGEQVDTAVLEQLLASFART